jgi:hypothetical protein
MSAISGICLPLRRREGRASVTKAIAQREGTLA